MKHRLGIIASVLVFAATLGFGLISTQATASAASDYFYTNENYVAVQGPNPFRVADQSERVTYRKVNDPNASNGYGNGVYLATGSIRSVDNRFCAPAFQTSSKKYDGDTKGTLYLECGAPGDSNKVNPRSITVSKDSPAGFFGGVNNDQRKAFDQGICLALKDIDQDMYANLCRSYAIQSEQDEAATRICNKYANQLKDLCDDYDKKTYNADHVPGGSTDPTCEDGSDGFDFNWAFCPIFNGVNDTTKWIFEKLIQPLLQTNPICLDASNTACDNTIYNIWSSFRIYGDIFLVIVLLIIIFGETIGGGAIDAYTVKKILPRLLAAAILINLSIYIMAFLIDVTNIVGGGLGQLITTPIGDNGAFKIEPDGITQGSLLVFGGGGLLAGGVLLGIGGIVMLMLGLAITGVIALLGVLVTLILRQTIITALLLLAPVAFALWCLPNTQQWFKRWWDMLFQMLLVYPMIVVLFAVADVMSYVTQHNGTSGPIASIVAFMLLIIPLYLVPFTLRSSNRLLGAIHGAVSGIGKQINAATGRRALSAAGRQANERGHRAGNYSMLSDRNKLFRGINTVTGVAANPKSMLRGRRGVRADRGAKRATQGAETLKDNAIFQANQGDDKFLLAVANRGLAEQKLASSKQDLEVARASGDMDGMASAQASIDAHQHALDAASQLGSTGRSTGVRHQALQSLARTGFQFESGAAGYAELSDTARQLSGGDQRAYSAIMNESQYNLRTAGRFDLGGINDGAGYKSGVSKASLYELANAKPESIQGMMDSVDLDAISPTKEHAVLYQELQAMKPNSKGVVRDEIVKQIENLEDFGIKDYLQQPTGNTRIATGPNGQQVTVPETNDEVAQREARTYERPDPNRLDNPGSSPTPGA